MNIITHETDIGSQSYPFLSQEFRISSYDAEYFREYAETYGDPLRGLHSGEGVALRLLKDGSLTDIRSDSAPIDKLVLDTSRGYFKLSKRLSRIIRPFQFYRFFHRVAISYNARLNNALWDGMGRISREMVVSIADSSTMSAEQRRRFVETQRFELTTAHAAGCDKAHVIVDSRLDGRTIVLPTGALTTEVKWDTEVTFVALNPVKSKDSMRIDIQSIVNLHPFLDASFYQEHNAAANEAAWVDLTSGKLHHSLAHATPEQGAEDTPYWLFDYLQRDMDPYWFAGVVKSMARIHLRGLADFRLPIPGQRLYIAPSAARFHHASRAVKVGQARLCHESASIYVANSDWLEYIARVLGGADHDDAIWVLTFEDHDGMVKHLLWRSPNQLGEYVVLLAESQLPSDMPKLDSRNLPTRIDDASHTYGTLPPAEDPDGLPYSVSEVGKHLPAMLHNCGVLGQYVNTLMAIQVTYGRLPHNLPARLEDVIDATVKDGRSIKPVRDWCKMVKSKIVAHETRSPTVVIAGSIAKRLRITRPLDAKHWLDDLRIAIDAQTADYWTRVESLASRCQPPTILIQSGMKYIDLGHAIVSAYRKTISEGLQEWRADPILSSFASHADDDMPKYALERLFSEAAAASAELMAESRQRYYGEALLGIIAALYSSPNLPKSAVVPESVKDGPLFQLGDKSEDGRQPGIANMLVELLVDFKLSWRTVQDIAVPVRLNGVWFNALNRGQYSDMASVPKPLRDSCKAKLAAAAHKLVGQSLTTRPQGDRWVLQGENPHFYGFLQHHPAQGGSIGADTTHQIRWARFEDGNLIAGIT